MDNSNNPMKTGQITVRDTLGGGDVTVGESGRIGIYVCGPTVYNHIHIGNSRVHLFWDVVVRYLRSRGYEVRFVWNITDIEDKIIQKANAEGVTWQDIVERYTDSFHERLALLNVGMPDVEPRATEHIPEMIGIIEDLIANGLAYPADNGDVYFAVESYAPYGELSNQRPSEMRDTEKGDTGAKRSHLDFTLWKASKPDEPSWESPWGMGRPGWHIECSAMVSKHLPDGADIHGGGTDIRFPHHENELAQSKGANPESEFVKAWCHHGMVRMTDEKMAKSVGNVVDIVDVVERFGADAVRMWLLQSHYSQPIDYSEEILEEKRRAYDYLNNFYARISDAQESSEFSNQLANDLVKKFDQAMQDDLNTPEALAAIFDASRQVGHVITAHPASIDEFSGLKDTFEDLLVSALGFRLSKNHVIQVPFLDRRKEVFSVTIRQANGQDELTQEIREKLARRHQARESKDWATSDRLRDELAALGWTVEDTAEGPVLHRR